MVGTRGYSFYRDPEGKWAQEACAGCRQQRFATGEPDKFQGRDREGIVEDSCGYQVCEVSNRGNIVLSRNLGCRTKGVAMWPNVVLHDTGQPTLKDRVQVRDIMRVVGIVTPFAPRGPVPG